MNEAGHRQRALDNEQAVADLGDPATKSYICALAIEAYWGAAFHWIVVGCMRKHAWHMDSHLGLFRRLNGLGELTIATAWNDLEQIRNNGWYSYSATPAQVAEAQVKWQDIRARALS